MKALCQNSAAFSDGDAVLKSTVCGSNALIKMFADVVPATNCERYMLFYTGQYLFTQKSYKSECEI